MVKYFFAPKSLLFWKSGREKRKKKIAHQIRKKVKKDVTSEQTKKMIILGDSIVKHASEYNLLHWLENSKVDLQNFTVTRIKCMQDYVKLFLRENPQHLTFFIRESNISTNKKLKQLANLIIEITPLMWHYQT